MSAPNRFFAANAFVDISAAQLGNPAAVAVWLTMWLWADKRGRVCVSHSRLAKALGVSPRTIRRHCEQLRKCGLLIVIHGGGNLNGQRPNTYQLNPEHAPQEVTQEDTQAVDPAG